jgi:uncharacterized membrane protein YfcA
MADAMTFDVVRAMMTGNTAVFVLGAFLGALVAGLAGFAFGLVASGIWLHVITPVQSAVLIAAFACVVQSLATWRMRHMVNWRHIMPFVVGGAIGIPIGAEILRHVSQQTMRGILGIFLIVFCIYFIAKPDLGRAKRYPVLDGVIGIAGGIIGALTGLAGIVINIWTTMQGLPKDEQRAVFQPSAVILFILTILWFGGAGIIPEGTGTLFLIGLPLVVVGSWIGLRLYGHLNETNFRRMVLGLLFVSGLTLVPSLFR